MGMCEVTEKFSQTLKIFMGALLLTPNEANMRLQEIAKEYKFSFQNDKCNERTLHAVIGFPTENGYQRIFVKYRRPNSDEGAIMLKLLPFQETLVFPAVYFADSHWLIMHHIEDHIPYLTDSDAFITTAMNHLYNIQSIGPAEIPIERVDMLESFLDDQHLDRIDRWLNEQRAVSLESLAEERKLVCRLRSERKRLLEIMEGEELVLSHGDYQPYNILRVGGAAYVIDWEDCAFRPRYLDIAWLLQALEAVYDLPTEAAWKAWATYRDKFGLGDAGSKVYCLYRVLSGLKYASNICSYEHHVLTFIKHYRLMVENWSKFMAV